MVESFMLKGVIGSLAPESDVRFRRRGVQAALISARLEAGRAAGCNLAMSVTQPSSENERSSISP